MDILHLAKDTKCSGYMIVVIDVFSRYAVGTIVPNSKSETVVIALRNNILVHSWSRPEEWVFDGASYFKAEVTASIEAWAKSTEYSTEHIMGEKTHSARTRLGGDRAIPGRMVGQQN